MCEFGESHSSVDVIWSFFDGGFVMIYLGLSFSRCRLAMLHSPFLIPWLLRWRGYWEMRLLVIVQCFYSLVLALSCAYSHNYTMQLHVFRFF